MLWLERCRGAPPPRCLYRGGAWGGSESRVAAQVPAFPSSYPWYDMVTDPNNVELRGRELAAYYQAIIGDEGVMTHPVTARHLTFDADGACLFSPRPCIGPGR